MALSYHLGAELSGLQSKAFDDKKRDQQLTKEAYDPTDKAERKATSRSFGDALCAGAHERLCHFRATAPTR